MRFLGVHFQVWLGCFTCNVFESFHCTALNISSAISSNDMSSIDSHWLADSLARLCVYVEERGVVALRSLWLLKRALELLIKNPVSPFRCLYVHAFYKKILYAPGHKLQPLSWAVCVCRGGGCHLWRYNFQTFLLSWTKWLYKNFVPRFCLFCMIFFRKFTIFVKAMHLFFKLVKRFDSKGNRSKPVMVWNYILCRSLKLYPSRWCNSVKILGEGG